MKKLNVRFIADKETVYDAGSLVEADSELYFEYTGEFIRTGFELSPFFLPLREGIFKHTDRAFGSLCGLFDDSLPDGWGTLLIDRYLKRRGAFFCALSPLEKLAYLGTETMGALTYYPPAEEKEKYESVIDLQKLADNASAILSGTEKEILPVLLKAGGSPGGARPKIVAGFNPENKIIISGESVLPEGFQHWLIKFNSGSDSAYSGRIEFAYSLLAKNSGIDMPETRLFDGTEPKSFFGIRRFDRGENNERFHTHTFGNLIHSNFRIPSSDYNDLIKVTKILTKDMTAVEEMFRRMVFNIFTGNRDDHVKNFSFIYNHKDLRWSPAPAYDLTFSEGPGGEHSMTIDGKGKNIKTDDILAVAKKADISQKTARNIIDQVKESLLKWKEIADIAGIPDRTATGLENIFTKNSNGKSIP